MDLQDKQLVCSDCGKDFTWTKGEQEFYKQKGFDNSPRRCPDCRKNKRQNGFKSSGPRQMFETTCSKCGGKASVPFKPTEGRDILCIDCFKAGRPQ